VLSPDARAGLDAGAAARKALGLGTGPLEDVLATVEDAAGVAVAVLALDDGVAGACMQRGGTPLAFVNGREALVRQRFTLAHELGHHRLGHPAHTDTVAAVTGGSRDPREVQANGFAAEFLMPYGGVKEWWQREGSNPVHFEAVVRLADHFHVSRSVARIRLQTMRILRDPERRAALDREIADPHLRRLYPMEHHDDTLARARHHLPRLPPTLRENALGDYLAGRTGLDELAARLGRSPDDVRASLRSLGVSG
jgi:Zn-dependent peptidase ImmA (M78 family)